MTVTDQAGKQRRSVTDALGRLAEVREDPTGLNYLTSYQYDVLGNLKTVTQGSQTRTFNYDSLSRLTSATNPESGTISYSYDANSNLTSKTDARGVTTSYGYDALNRNTSLTHTPVTNGTTDVYLYYDTATNGKGRFGYSVSYNARWYGDGRPYWHADVTTGYDALGRPTGKWQGFMLFNAQGQATTWQPYNLSRTYNLAGGVTSETYPSGRTVSYSYDTAGRLQNFNGTLGDGVARGYATGITYNSAGLMSRETYGTQTPLSLNLHYNNRQQMVDLRLGTNSGDEWDWSRGALIFYYGTAARNAWNPFANSSDNNGNVLRQVNYAPLTAGGYVIPQLDDYTYDALNRVTAASEIQQNSSGVWSGNVFTQTFSYDRWGNRGIDVASTTPNVPGVTRKALSFNTANNRLTAIDGVAVGYDSAGNQTTISTSGQPDYELRDYDAENRMTRATKSGVTSYYHYDGSGKRVRRVIGGAETWQVYGFDGELIAEYNVSGVFNGSNAPAAVSPAKEYGYRSGKLLVVWDGSQSGNAAFRWLVTDHLGSTRMEADLSGSLTTLKRHDYLPFGEELVATTGAQRGGIGYEPPASNVRQKFTGHERDGETGLDFMQARYCASVQGRFTSPDPLYLEMKRLSDPQQLNIYVYARNNPLKFIDPSGLDIEVTGDAYQSYLDQLQQSVSFKIQRNSKNKVVIVDSNGNELSKDDLKKLGKGLKGSEKDTFKAITDEKHHVSVAALKFDPTGSVFFGAFRGGGKQTLDFSDINLLAATDKAAASQVVLHETLEAYAGSKGKGYLEAHEYANGFPGAGGLVDVSSGLVWDDSRENLRGQVNDYSMIGRQDVNFRMTH